MKKIVLTLLALSFVLCASASEYSGLPYKNIKDKSKVSVSQDGMSWTTKFNKKKDLYYVKKGSEFYLRDGSPAFSTGCSYMFLTDDNLIGYSIADLKFYEFFFQNGQIAKRELSTKEVQSAFKKYKIVKISDFSQSTNSLKVKKGLGKLKLIVINDTDKDFTSYAFTSGNAKFVQYPATGILKIKKSGMIQLSKNGENTKDCPWFILLIK